MRITIVMPSRGRPSGLLSILTALDALATGAHDITYVLLIDSDDDDTRLHTQQWQHAGMLPERTHIIIEERRRAIAARMNEAVGAFPADVYCGIPDDGFPLTQHWDTMFEGLRELPCFAWQERNDPGNATYIAISERFRQGTGRMYPEHFPFWFADTWVLEVHLLAFAKGIAIVNQLQMGGKRGKTQGMRDLEFWFRFFTATRVERIAEAERLTHEFGFTVNVRRERQDHLALLEAADAEQLKRIPHYESMRGANEKPASQMYIAAKAKAEAWLEANERRVLVPMGPQIEVVH